MGKRTIGLSRILKIDQEKFNSIDLNKDGLIDFSESKDYAFNVVSNLNSSLEHFQKVFESMDKNKDGFVDKEEFN